MNVPGNGKRLKIHGGHGLPFLVRDESVASESAGAARSTGGGERNRQNGAARDHLPSVTCETQAGACATCGNFKCDACK